MKRIKSCGCSRKGNGKGNNYGFKHGLTARGVRNPIYELRNRMLTRCYNAKPNDYPYYQGKGIKACDEWINNPKSFQEWAINNGWYKGCTIDRIDPNGDYCPENCRFLSKSDNIKKRHALGRYKKVQRDIVKYCFRCKCTGNDSSPCKYEDRHGK
jgi:hypothetical protein